VHEVQASLLRVDGGQVLSVATPILFHGPGALAQASSIQGHVLGWFGAKGLTVAEAREALTLLEHPAARGVLLLGPLDQASREALDALLKTVEEPPEHVELRLFALEEGLVPATIRSRCLRQFCSEGRALDPGQARELIEWALAGKVGELAERVLNTKSEEPLPSLESLARALVGLATGEPFHALWKALRGLPAEPTRPELFTALTALRR